MSEYRPFRESEFRSLIGRYVKRKNYDRVYMPIIGYIDGWIVVGMTASTPEHLLEYFEFADTGEPFGVKVDTD